MLTLARKPSQRIFIGPPHAPIAVITLVKLRQGQAFLGIEAEGLAINREEIAVQIVEQMQGPPKEVGQ